MMKDSKLEQLPDFVRGHRLAYLAHEDPTQPEYSADQELLQDDEDAVGSAEVITSWTGAREAPVILDRMATDWSILASQPETFHRPILDLDFDAALIPSTSADHHHLYLDKVLTWSQYVKLLDVLAEVGLIEPGYRDASVAREFTSVRLPWITKAEGPKSRGWTREGREAIEAEQLAEYRQDHVIIPGKVNDAGFPEEG